MNTLPFAVTMNVTHSERGTSIRPIVLASHFEPGMVAAIKRHTATFCRPVMGCEDVGGASTFARALAILTYSREATGAAA
ncbi:hypothetical protein [Paraburkholderia haematera]|uniref:Uncharacterized protein n=1 Tax=Paraburkholderia haematera TaxID=2793077 RepID=A0ABN7KUW0_9BURK|nr:hypothetical protein [Paraburkholderia haematera]CAE6714214.1 hypothetical protein R69888_01294 [Paraburkholderia haematera]